MQLQLKLPHDILNEYRYFELEIALHIPTNCKHFLTFLDIEVLQSPAPAIPRYQTEPHKPGADRLRAGGAEWKREEWQGVLLVPDISRL